jgi:hypothetical protein
MTELALRRPRHKTRKWNGHNQIDGVVLKSQGGGHRTGEVNPGDRAKNAALAGEQHEQKGGRNVKRRDGIGPPVDLHQNERDNRVPRGESCPQRHAGGHRRAKPGRDSIQSRN